MFIYALGQDRGDRRAPASAPRGSRPRSPRRTPTGGPSRRRCPTSRGSSASRRSTRRRCAGRELGWVRRHASPSCGTGRSPGRSSPLEEGRRRADHVTTGPRRNPRGALQSIDRGLAELGLGISLDSSITARHRYSRKRRRGFLITSTSARVRSPDHRPAQVIPNQGRASRGGAWYRSDRRAGEIFGFLGPNGAGKTTTLRMLTTLLPVDAGAALWPARDVRRHPAVVRRRIGYVGQLGGADVAATGARTCCCGRLYGLSAADATRRCDGTGSRCSTLVQFLRPGPSAPSPAGSAAGWRWRSASCTGRGCSSSTSRPPASTRRTAPTSGISCAELRDSGTTICLTTHYLDEADQLCDRVAIIDHGRVIARGHSR